MRLNDTNIKSPLYYQCTSATKFKVAALRLSPGHRDKIPLVSAASPGVELAQEVRAGGAEGPPAHDETLRAREDRRPQEGRADPSPGAQITHTPTTRVAFFETR